MKKIQITGLIALLLTVAEANAQDLYQDKDILVSRQRFTKTCEKEDFLDNTTEINTPKMMKAIATTMYAGGGEREYAMGVSQLTPPQKGSRQNNGLTYYYYLPPSSDFALCRVINVGVGTGQQGIETKGDATFGGQLFRDPAKKQENLSIWTNLPCTVGADIRIDGKFDLIFVRKSKLNKAECMEHGAHAWRARNNETMLHPKTVKHYKD